MIDEFQVLLAGRDAVADEAVTLLEDLARRGRSQGIHLILASQDVSGIEALWGRSGLIGQFTLRIALPKARRILADNNLAAAVIPRFHAVVNAESGVAGANQIVRLPDAGDRAVWRRCSTGCGAARPDGCEEPRLFDGDAVPRLPGRLPPGRPGAGRRRAGRLVTRRGARRADRRRRPAGPAAAGPDARPQPGGARHPHRRGVRRARGGRAVAGRAGPRALQRRLPRPGRGPPGRPADRRAALRRLVRRRCPSCRCLGHPALRARLRAGRRQPTSATLRHLLADGPEQRTHVLGWWRSVARLRDSLGGPGARLDPIGAWVALDVQGADLAPLYPQPGGPAWYPRTRRALFFDRSVHRTPGSDHPVRGEQ